MAAFTSTDNTVSDLLKVAQLRRGIKQKFTTKKLQNQGLEHDLSIIYKPLTTSQTKNTNDIITHLSNLSNASNKKIIDFKDTFKNFPDLIASIDNVKSLLDIKTTEIINKIKTKDPGAVNDIEELDQEHKLFEDALSEISDADTGIDTLLTDQSLGAVSKTNKKTVTKTKEYVEKEASTRDIMKKEEGVARAAYDHVSKLSKEDLKDYLGNETHALSLIRFVEHNPDINLSSNPWRKINVIDPELYKRIKDAKTVKKGKGFVKFLPSGKSELVKELFRLIGSYKSGNKNVYNELNAVVDQLRRSGVLTINQSKQIYKIIV